MLNRFKSEDEGFTLIELLVVILIIGILAAIALPSFLGQQKKGQDASAKSDVRNAVSAVESCYADEQDYTKCVVAGTFTAAGISGITFTPAPTVSTYTVTATSKSANTFSIVKAADGTTTRSCTTAGTGSCKTGGVW